MKKTDKSFIETIKKEENIFNGSYLKLNRLIINMPNGKEAIREVVKVKDAAAVLPIDKNGNVCLVKQYRPAIKKTIIEVPAGIKNYNESIKDCARRECEEETGFLPKKLLKLITYAHAEGYSTGFITLFLGTNLENTGKIALDETEFLEPVCMPYLKLIDMIKKNKIVDSKTILCGLLSQEIILKTKNSSPKKTMSRIII